MSALERPNTGRRRRVNVGGEHYYVIVTRGPDGLAVDVSPSETTPKNAVLRSAVETVCATINSLLAEVVA